MMWVGVGRIEEGSGGGMGVVFVVVVVFVVFFVGVLGCGAGSNGRESMSVGVG